MLESVITRLCRDCVDGSCVSVCPVAAIVRHMGEGLPNQLFIDPETCIACGACAPECPWEAIFDLDDVPEPFEDDIALNRRAYTHADEYEVPDDLIPAATPDRASVERNRQKWLSLSAHLGAEHP